MHGPLLAFCCACLLYALPWQVPPVFGAGWPRIAWAAGCVVVVAASVLGVSWWVCRWRPRRCLLVVLAAGAGVLWQGLEQQQALRERLQAAPDALPLWLTVRVLGEPAVVYAGAGAGSTADGAVRAATVARFSARVVTASAGRDDIRAGVRLRLSWYEPPAVGADELWRVLAVVRGPWSYAAPGGFDYERWLLGKGLSGTGSVRVGERIAPAAATAAGLRSLMAGPLASPRLLRGGVLRALLLGAGGSVPEPVWELLRSTGTVHLLVVSGLHVGLAVGAGWLLGRLLACCVPLLPLYCPAPRLGSIVGALSGVGYALLAGAGTPVLRAMLAASTLLLLRGWGIAVEPRRLLVLVLALVLVVQPLAIHLQGLWLSFAAVAVLLLGFPERIEPRRIHSPLGSAPPPHRSGPANAPLARLGLLVRAQLLLTFALAPLLLAATGQLAVVSPLANLLAVPLVSVLVVPPLLGSAALGLAGDGPTAAFASWLSGLADLGVHMVLYWLQRLQTLPVLAVHASGPRLLLAEAALLWLLCTPRHRQLVVLLAAAAVPLLPAVQAVPHGELKVTALDVGQGSAIVLDTLQHRLLFDAGPAFPGGFETGSAVVVPSLLATGPGRLDALVLSHADLDHTGGAGSVVERIEVARAYGAVPDTGGDDCNGRRWRWDGVEFNLLSLARPRGATDNERSCVLLVRAASASVLLAGDLTAPLEAQLLRRLGTPVTLMFAPHHGSSSSSSRALVRVADPQLVWISAGLGNRYGHPHPRVVARYRAQGAAIHQTGRHGTLSWRSDQALQVRRWRSDWSPYWRAQLAAPPGS
ncbi:MAG: DNA internalization-related competence protein ComEC/Rec2 [Pseudomonadales bacterium]